MNIWKLYKEILIVMAAIMFVITGIAFYNTFIKKPNSTISTTDPSTMVVDKKVMAALIKEANQPLADSLAAWKIKLKNVQSFITYKTVYKDTLFHSSSYDTAYKINGKSVYRENVNQVTRCQTLTGYIQSTISGDSIQSITYDLKSIVEDTNTLILHLNRKWFFGRLRLDALIYSNCKGDTVKPDKMIFNDQRKGIFKRKLKSKI